MAGVFVDPWDAPTSTLVLTAALPLALAILATRWSLGGRRGLVAALVLVSLAAYWAWWFGWALDADISPFSIDGAATGLAEASTYEVSLLVALWPFVVATAAVVVVVARRRGRRAWPALGLLSLALVVLSFPYGATWDDGCNAHSGASPLVTKPFAGTLMDHGVGVIPGGSSTLVYCPGTGDREWKPFWLGDDHLPPGPGIYGTVSAAIHVPDRLYRAPQRAPGGRLDHLALAYWPERDELYALLVSDRQLVSDPDWPEVEVSIDGVPNDDSESFDRHGANGWCYAVVWVANRRLPPHRHGETLGVDLRLKTRVLARGRSRVQVLETQAAVRRLSRPLGCPRLP